MQNHKLKKFIAAVLLSGEILIFPLFAFAQAVPDCNANTGSSCAGGYIVGIAANTVFQAALAPITTANEACAKSEEAYEHSDSAAHLAFSGLSIIGGSLALKSQLTAKVGAYNGFIACREAVLTSLDALVAPNVFTSSLKQQQVTNSSNAMSTYKGKLEETQARLNNALQSFWKTLVFNILIKTSKSVANKLINKVVNNYKVNNPKQYVDSVATLMYDNQFLRSNFPSNNDQMMARTILQNPQYRSKVQPAIYVAADDALGFNPKTLDPNDPDYYLKMARVGSTEANPYYRQSVYVSGVEQSRSSSMTYAQAQVAQGNGYKAPVNCSGSLLEQQSVDGQAKAANERLADRKALLNDLEQAKGLGQPVSDADIQQAQTDYDSAQNALKVLGSGSQGKSAIKMCEVISSPAQLVSQGIDEAFKAVGTNMAQYSDNNLPGFTSIISDVATQISTNLILGGNNPANTLLMNEDKIANSAVRAAEEEARYKKVQQDSDDEVRASKDTALIQANGVQAVAGAFTSEPNLKTRGFPVNISTRGR